jgi:amino acid transporter
MGNKSSSTEERVFKEYPNLSLWLQGNMAQGAGNLILTAERLIFLNRVALEEWQLEKVQQLSREGDFDKVVEFSLKLHKKNFQILLSDVTNVRMGLFSLLPLPRLCMRIQHLTKKDNLVETSFGFRIPLLKGLVELEITLVMGWITAVKTAVKRRQQAKAR